MTNEEYCEIMDNSNFLIDSANTYDMKIKEALEKQIPKKTKETSFGTECSVCNSIVKIRGCAKFAYCPYCGNKIDW